MLSSQRAFLLTVLNIFNYLDRYLINALLPTLAITFSLSNTRSGQLSSCFVIGYVIFSPIFGYLGDRMHRPTLMAIGVILWGIATVSSGLAASFLFLVFARILVGVGEASFGTIAPGYLKDFEPDPIKLNQKLSKFFVAIPVGSALGYVVGGFITELHSWQMAFFLAGLPPIILAFFLFAYPESRPISRPREALPSPWQAIKQILSSPVIRLTLIGYALNTFALTAIAAFVPKFGVGIGFSLSSINAWFGGILVCTGLLGTLLGSTISSRFAEKGKTPAEGLLRFIALSSFLAIPFLFFAFRSSNPWLFLGCCAIAELCVFAALAPVNTVLVVKSPAHLVTLTQGVTILTINLLGTLPGPQLVGFASDILGLANGLQLSTLAMAMCAMVWWRAQYQTNETPTQSR